jgi:hypothetical protein
MSAESVCLLNFEEYFTWFKVQWKMTSVEFNLFLFNLRTISHGLRMSQKLNKQTELFTNSFLAKIIISLLT